MRKEGLRLRLNGRIGVVNLEVFPLRPAAALERYFLVIFEDVTPPAPAPVQEAPKVKAAQREAFGQGPADCRTDRAN